MVGTSGPSTIPKALRGNPAWRSAGGETIGNLIKPIRAVGGALGRPKKANGLHTPHRPGDRASHLRLFMVSTPWFIASELKSCGELHGGKLLGHPIPLWEIGRTVDKLRQIERGIRVSFIGKENLVREAEA